MPVARRGSGFCRALMPRSTAWFATALSKVRVLAADRSRRGGHSAGYVRASKRLLALARPWRPAERALCGLPWTSAEELPPHAHLRGPYPLLALAAEQPTVCPPDS